MDNLAGGDSKVLIDNQVHTVISTLSFILEFFGTHDHCLVTSDIRFIKVAKNALAKVCIFR